MGIHFKFIYSTMEQYMTLGENSSPDEIRMVMKTIMRMGGAVGALKRGTTRGILPQAWQASLGQAYQLPRVPDL